MVFNVRLTGFAQVAKNRPWSGFEPIVGKKTFRAKPV